MIFICHCYYDLLDKHVDSNAYDDDVLCEHLIKNVRKEIVKVHYDVNRSMNNVPKK